MGFVNKLRNELIDIVEWIDDSRHTIVWRFPRYHNQIKNGAQLIVRPGQMAILVEQGKIADVFEPGTHRLSTDNLPILSNLKGWRYGFHSPFKAEIYFVTTRQITEMKWGTPNPVIMRDPDFGPIRIRAFGTYTIKAIDPEALLRELVGTDGSFESDEITVLLRSIINNAFAEVVAKSGISVLDLASNYSDLSEQIRQACIDKVDTEYGLDFPQLYIVNISVPEEVEKALDARSSMGMIGNLGAYEQYQLGQAIATAAANPAGGLAAAGVGLRMGMAYTGQMSPAPGHHATVPPIPGQGSTQWHVAVNGQPTGPFSLLQLREAVASGQLTGASLVWSPGMATWSPASAVADLAELFMTPPPLPRGQI
ncbi:SPFH domain-containing protein [Candidatus Entotheonella palauensis]|uniref:Antifreeze protein, type I n=1 Tax=Candidatus Entotheonella gemina TaxID=1429439 RepID=W4MG82_9BACT|nr:SPFH domain-containing protein [Candidatus Entotheonella palauensis]ETX08931.1 MAG: antifreeze protein, type I [Candidatus Entotheonella gemina]